MEIILKSRLLGSRFARIIGLNLLIALALSLLFWVFQGRTSENRLYDELVSALIHALIYGSMFGLIMPYLGDRLAHIRRPWNWLSIGSGVMIITAVSTLVIDVSVYGLGYLPLERFWQDYLFKSITVFVIAFVICLSVGLYETYRENIHTANLRLRTNELEKERALNLASEAQMALLESRLHPHFLFNTLNSISALIAEDPVVADKTVQRLASVLRSSLDASRRSSTSIGDEVKLVTDYLEIEKVRFRDRLRYNISVDEGLKSVRVPPMILQPIVENSVKFAVGLDPKGGTIRVSAHLIEREIKLEVWDDGPGFTEDTIPVGHGLDNLRARLALLPGRDAKLRVDPKDGGTAVTVTMTLDRLQ